MATTATESPQQSLRWLLADFQGSVRDVLVTRAPGDTTSNPHVAHYTYGAFGTLIGATGTQPAKGRFMYTGQELDPETGLYQYNARYYSPEAGRFVGQDPAGFSAGDSNLYRYVGNDTVNLVDPTGLGASRNPSAPRTTSAPDYRTDYLKGLDQVSRDDPWAVVRPNNEYFLPWLITRGIFYDMWATNVAGVAGGYQAAHETARRGAETAADPAQRASYVMADYALYPMEAISHGSVRFAQGGTYAIAGPAIGAMPGGTQMLNGLHVASPYIAATATTLHATSLLARASDPDSRQTITAGDVTDLGLGIWGTYQAHRSVQEMLWTRPTYGVSVPRTAVAEAGGVIGPTIGRSGYRTMGEFRDAVFTKYQQFYDQADAIAQARIAAGRWPNDPMIVGGRIDAIARARLKGWLGATEGIGDTSATGVIQVNRRLYNPLGSGFRVPDVRIRGANIIFDGTIANSPMKSGLSPQIMDFRTFSGGSNVVIVRPTRMGGSHGIAP